MAASRRWTKVDFDLRYGEVHALVGENGAGKSTLIKVLGGIIPRNEGRIVFEGQEVDFQRPLEAHARRDRHHPPGTVDDAVADGDREHVYGTHAAAAWH